MATNRVTVTLDIDFGLLKDQKSFLLDLLIRTRKYDQLEGILNIIDEIQDQAVENGVEEEVVFFKCEGE